MLHLLHMLPKIRNCRSQRFILTQKHCTVDLLWINPPHPPTSNPKCPLSASLGFLLLKSDLYLDAHDRGKMDHANFCILNRLITTSWICLIVDLFLTPLTLQRISLTKISPCCAIAVQCAGSLGFMKHTHTHTHTPTHMRVYHCVYPLPHWAPATHTYWQFITSSLSLLLYYHLLLHNIIYDIILDLCSCAVFHMFYHMTVSLVMCNSLKSRSKWETRLLVMDALCSILASRQTCCWSLVSWVAA